MRRLVTFAATVVVAGAAVPAARADWPVYGHDLANTRDAGTAGPTKGEARSLQRAWSFASDTGDFTATPVVAGGVLVAGDNGGHVYALDAATGEKLWSRDVGGPVHASAALTGGLALVPVGEVGRPRLVALALRDGAVRWQRTLTEQPGADAFGSAAVHDGVAYIGTSGQNGDLSTARGSVVAVDTATGDVRWRTYTVPPGHDGGPVWSTPAVDPATGRLYVGTGNAYHEPAADTTDAILALDAATGAILGHHQATEGDTFHAGENPTGPDADFGASPNLIAAPGGRALVGEGAKSGVYWALDRASMRPVWQTTIGPAIEIGGVLGSTAYDGTHIYGTDAADGQVWALNRDGTTAWNSADPSTADFSPVAVGNGVVYTLNPGGWLVARDAATGAVLGQVGLGGLSFGGMSIAGRAVYAAVGTGPLPQPAPQDDPKGSIVAFGDTSASGPPRVDFSVKLTSTTPGAPTGLGFHLRFQPAGDPDGKPAALRTAVVRGPEGLRFDSGAMAVCTASDEEIRARGSDACPAETKLTVGRFSAMTGFGPPADPLAGDDHVFNGPDQLIEIISAPGSSVAPGFDRLTIEGSTLTAHPPTTPGGPPDGETAVKSIDFAFPARTGGGRSLVTTPPSCPPSGAWTTTATFGFADGTSQTVSSATPCERAAAAAGSGRAAPRARMRLRVLPRRVHAGRMTRVRFRVVSGAARCRSRALVRLGARRVRTDGRGRASLRLRLRARGTRRARVTHAGCRAAATTVRVVR